MLAIQSKLPAKTRRLSELAYNLWWSWTPEARELFRRLDYPLWRETEHNPVEMLIEMSADQLAERTSRTSWLLLYDKVMLKYDQMLDDGHTWFHTTYPELLDQTIAYFSFEFGLHNSLPIYSGGLGILSGDHAKEASDLGLPFVGVGFMYPQGYFRQRVPSHGWQEAVYQLIDIDRAPIQIVKDDKGNDLTISVELGHRIVFARIWQVLVGRVSLYLLDTDVDDNDPWDRELSARLYSGDSEMRIRQEIMLGVGGVRALDALGIEPTAWHMNEGHSAFLLLENVRKKVDEGYTFPEAVRIVRENSIFTTHTPVPAGHDAFSYHLLDQYFANFWDKLGVSREEFLALGAHQEDWGMSFNMTVLALQLSAKVNGVSKLHGEVSRDMWRSVWPDRKVEDVPITSVTNGIHIPSWIASELDVLFMKYLGPDWRDRQDDPLLWQRIMDIPSEEVWEVHMLLKFKLMRFLRSQARRSWIGGQSDPTQVLTSGTMLDPESLTIGFARRFATYKRATLIFRDAERLRRLLLDIHRPVQIVFAGKAHPADDPGKALIQEIYNMAKHNQLGGRIAFVEDYDMHSARYFTQGVDVWLNTPLRPHEASGTSGMKASINGIPNLSILDGWWVEGYNGANGWAINGEQFDNQDDQDEHDSNVIYRLLEEEIVPLYYDRHHDNIPRGWIEVMREAIRSNAPRYSMRRMVKEYTEKLYLEAMETEY